jgi:peptidoglycan hydrolase CwlO-like protein
LNNQVKNITVLIASIQNKMSKLLKQRKELTEHNNDLQIQMDNLVKDNEEMRKTSVKIKPIN